MMCWTIGYTVMVMVTYVHTEIIVTGPHKKWSVYVVSVVWPIFYSLAIVLIIFDELDNMVTKIKRNRRK